MSSQKIAHRERYSVQETRIVPGFTLWACVYVKRAFAYFPSREQAEHYNSVAMDWNAHAAVGVQWTGDGIVGGRIAQ